MVLFISLLDATPAQIKALQSTAPHISPRRHYKTAHPKATHVRPRRHSSTSLQDKPDHTSKAIHYITTQTASRRQFRPPHDSANLDVSAFHFTPLTYHFASRRHLTSAQARTCRPNPRRHLRPKQIIATALLDVSTRHPTSRTPLHCSTSLQARSLHSTSRRHTNTDQRRTAQPNPRQHFNTLHSKPILDVRAQQHASAHTTPRRQTNPIHARSRSLLGVNSVPSTPFPSHSTSRTPVHSTSLQSSTTRQSITLQISASRNCKTTPSSTTSFQSSIAFQHNTEQASTPRHCTT